MDGPNVDWEVYRDLFQEHRCEDEELPDLLNIWICGLHLVHGNFQNWSKKIWMGNCLMLINMSKQRRWKEKLQPQVLFFTVSNTICMRWCLDSN